MVSNVTGLETIEGFRTYNIIGMSRQIERRK
jgi:hypothetical protein